MENKLDTSKMDLATLMEAEGIKKDPEKMKAVLKHTKKQMKIMKSLQDLKDYYTANFEEKITASDEPEKEDNKKEESEE